MGNGGSIYEQQETTRLKTWAIAGYISIDRDQCFRLRNSCLRWTDPSSPHLSRHTLEYAIQVSKIVQRPDAEIIMDLYTMWDVRGDGSVPLLPFFVGLSPLACHGDESFRAVLRYALQIAHVTDKRYIDRNELYVVLKSLNCTVAYLGDAFLKNSRLVEIVQDTLTTMSLVATQPNEEIQFPLLLKEDVVAVIAVEPLIKQLLLQSNHVGTPPPSPTPEQHNDDHHTRRRPPKVLKKEDEEVLMRKPQPQPPQLQQKLVLKSQLESYIESLPKQPHTTKPLGKKPTCSSQAQLPSQLLLLRENQEQERQLMKLQPQLPKQKPQPLSPKPQPLSPKQKPQKSQSKPKQQFMLPKQSSQSKQQQQQVMFPKQQKSHSKPKQPLQPKQQQPQKSQPKQSKPKQKQPSLPMRKPILKTGGAASKQFDPSALYWSRPAEYNTSSSHSGEQGDDEGTEAYGGLSSFYETVATTEEELHSPPSYIPSVPTDEYTSMNSFLPPAMRCLIRVGSSTLSRSNSMTSHTTMSHPQTTTTTTTTKNHGKDTVGENNKEEDDDKKHWSYCRKSSKSLFSSHPL